MGDSLGATRQLGDARTPRSRSSDEIAPSGCVRGAAGWEWRAIGVSSLRFSSFFRGGEIRGARYAKGMTRYLAPIYHGTVPGTQSTSYLVARTTVYTVYCRIWSKHEIPPGNPAWGTNPAQGILAEES